MVEKEITTSDIGLVVRFKRVTWSALLSRNYWATELIIVIKPQHEAEFLADWELYKTLERAAQEKFLATMKSTRYCGRLLHPAPPRPVATPADAAQVRLF